MTNFSTSEPPRAVDRLTRVRVLAIAAMLTSAVAAVLSAWAVREVERRAGSRGVDTHLQVLGQLEAEWNSDEMLDRRAQAAAALLKQRPDRAVEAVLLFFDEVGYLAERYGVDRELVWYRFHTPALVYWAASEFVRKSESGRSERYLAHGRKLVDSLRSIERARSGGAESPEPTRREIEDFLLEEARRLSCQEEEGESSDEPAQMTPLGWKRLL
ncbi:MAG: hypothetical protein KatS3mg077_2640 [Candidatus Binatia bacterium]|nr:MAG: hypothetical protein KatS3mg077_2640 [Candidatus Binatia bacterium]